MIEVSVIVPCFNQSHYLNQAIDSILGQDMADWEAVVIDDGSTDETAEVARGYNDGRIRYIHQENRGLSGARNTGIKLAQGRCLAFLDADDEWEPAFLSICLEVLNESTAAAGVYTLNSFIDSQGKRLPQVGGAAVMAKDFRRRLLEGGFFPPHAALVRRQTMQAIGHFDESLTSLEDWELWLRLSTHGTMVGIPRPLARYRVYPGSMSTDTERMQANRLAVLRKHFGPAEGDPAHWSDEMRYAYAFAYRTAAIGFLQEERPDRCWQLLGKAIGIWPDIILRLDTYYELACGAGARGYRGLLEMSELQAIGQVILKWLDGLFAGESDALQAKRGQAYGQAYLALAILADRNGDWRQARIYLRRAIVASPGLASDGSVLRRMLKLHGGRWVIDRIRANQVEML